MENKSTQLVEANSDSFNNYSLALTLFEIDRKYQEKFSFFLKEIQNINSKIELLKKDIKQIENSIKKESKEIEELKSLIDAELLYLDKLNEKYITKVNIAIEMKKHNKFDDSYKMVLRELEEDIRELEIDILEKELQKENLQLKILPSKQRIDELKVLIDKLETEKNYIEALGINMAPELKNSNSSPILEIL